MSNEHQIPDNGGFEREDLSAKAVFGFLIALAVLGVVVYFVVNVTYHGLNSYFASHQPAESPMRPAGTGDTRDLRAAEVKAKIENTFPQPLLETDERNELNDFRTQEANQLNSYGWVDQKAGTVRIPIERAMQLLAQRGLPVYSGGANSGSQAGTKMASAGKTKAAGNAAKQ